MSALRELGYKVADSLETAEFLSGVSMDFCGKATINNVFTAYEDGFEVNQDLPGHMLWEELYSVSPEVQFQYQCTRKENRAANQRSAFSQSSSLTLRQYWIWTLWLTDRIKI